MIRTKEINKIKKQIEAFQKTLKQLQADLIRTYEIAKPCISDSEVEVLEKKERRFRMMKKKLEHKQETLKALQAGTKEPKHVKARMVRRPENETLLLQFCEA